MSAEVIAKLEAFAQKHGASLVSRGEVGFGRPAVGIVRGNGYLDLAPLDGRTYEPLPGFSGDDERIDAPEGVDAYHKHRCLCVLVAPDKAETTDEDYAAALRGLLSWVERLESQGEVEVVSYRTGATGLQALLSGSEGWAIRFKT